MNNDTVQGKWKQLRGTIKITFGKLTDDDLLQANGNADKLMGALQTRYGYTKEKAQSEWKKFARDYEEHAADAQADLTAAIDDVKGGSN